MGTPSIPKLMTRQEVETALHICSRTVYRLVDAGDLPAFKVGRDWRFSEQDVAAYLAAGRRSAA